MALETVSYIGSLVASNPISTDTVSQADDHIRLIKQVLLNTFPNLTGQVTLNQAQMNNPIPKGVISMWYGAIANIPSGWAICDGTNETPNLIDKFIVGAGDTYAVAATGGDVVSGTGGDHTHSLVSAGAHDHGGVTGAVASFSTGTAGVALATSNHTHSITSGGTHTHSVNAVGTHTHTSLPPYYALAYIMKL